MIFCIITIFIYSEGLSWKHSCSLFQNHVDSKRRKNNFQVGAVCNKASQNLQTRKMTIKAIRGEVQINKEVQMKVGPTRTLVWLETDVEGVQPWQPELLETTGTWTGLQAWKQYRYKNLAYYNALTRKNIDSCLYYRATTS